MRTLISSTESESKRSTLESSSTSSSSRIVGCSSLILANPLCFSRTLLSQASQRESLGASARWPYLGNSRTYENPVKAKFAECPSRYSGEYQALGVEKSKRNSMPILGMPARDMVG